MSKFESKFENFNIKPTRSEVWTGRDDSAEDKTALRLHQVVQQVRVQDLDKLAHTRKDIALLGFACDEGVRRNKGRVGAKTAPEVLRKNLANLAYNNNQQWFDFGDLECSNADLETAQANFSELVKQIHSQSKLATLVLGGGHETAYTHALGVFEAHKDKKIGIINFDAHLDMRKSDTPNSGTPFLQLAQYCEEQDRDLKYLCIGVNKSSNTQALFNNAQKYKVQMLFDDNFDINFTKEMINYFLEEVDCIYLTLDLDVLSASEMFAVSAPANFGKTSAEILELIKFIGASKQIIAADVVEYNPIFDRDNICARVAARFIWELSRKLYR